MKNSRQSIEKFKAGHFEKGMNYKYFVPSNINHFWVWEDGTINALLEKAYVKLGELNSYARLVPSTDLYIQLHVTKEAVESSKIEGTRTQIDEALLPEDEIQPERRSDWIEVNNYVRALYGAVRQLDKLPLSSRLLCQAHKILMNGVRGNNKLPGEYRTSQNWIGGATLSEAVFIPPAAHYVHPLIGDLENFLHNDDVEVPALIRIGIAHYQYETIHPFLDGNGRIGRLLIPLFLISTGILKKPLLYLSVYFEKNRSLYYENLRRVSERNELVNWLKFFLTGVIETATNGAKTLDAVLELKVGLEKEILTDIGRRQASGQKLLEHLFHNPVINIKKVEEVCQLSTKAANDLVRIFEERKWLVQENSSVRFRWFVFEPYISLFK
ncbi:Fic family protein [Pseudobacter ginsenosidimutans]|uniref:Fic family protein n=1 Tax=Pseudobacter ginsenosidimutans TaxID=661488 RepID=A0A4Q7MTP7_9BACT|nr:Fic/DOC family N-terminal domain-containing protein [Pseudobacter ginsenosidimutans]QEC41879.1 Fic family protein [Pseudobacter ginsenosidimutans]RZS71299.1 Fic family protein [Pseudobacter ginsenosidimutans]